MDKLSLKELSIMIRLIKFVKDNTNSREEYSMAVDVLAELEEIYVKKNVYESYF